MPHSLRTRPQLGLTLRLLAFGPGVGYLEAVWREWQFLSGQRPGRGLVSLYQEDFQDVTSIDLWADLQAAASDSPQAGHKQLSALLASANLEGRTREFPIAITRTQATNQVTFEGAEINFREHLGHHNNLARVH